MRLKCKIILTIIITLTSVQPVQASILTPKYLIIKRFENKLYYVKHKLLIKEFIIITGQSKKLIPSGRYTVVKTVPKHYSYKDMDGKTLNHPLISLKSTKTNDVIYRICETNQEKNTKKNININCIHMKNIDIQWLHTKVREGTTVIIE
ncbi:L,D-transpeptidase [Bacillus cereus]|uniref:L,D-transpeptidase n=1 Tax=Bacillus cereus TaxID=1396 RepID=UPI0033118377|nr:L,D-transpeptidase [Bacillus cereus]